MGSIYLVYFLLMILVTVPTQFLGFGATGDASVTTLAVYHTLDLIQTPMMKIPQNYVDLILVPLGWSKDGKFAYIIGIDPGGAGYEETGFFRWVIQDMVTDKYLWESKKGLEEGLPEGYLSNTAVEKVFGWVYSKFKVKYQTQFDRYNIIIDEHLSLETFPLSYQQSEYRGVITDLTRETKYDFPDLVGKYRVIVSKNGVRKTIADYRNITDCLLDVQMVGYIKSPFEPRMALVIGEIARGWEGPPHGVRFSFVGSHLEKGF